MDIIKRKKKMAKIMIISVIFASILLLFNQSNTMAATLTTYDMPQIFMWLSKSCNPPKIECYVYDNNGVETETYAFVMPEVSSTYNIGYDGAMGKYFYNIKNGDVVVEQYYFDVYTAMAENGRIGYSSEALEQYSQGNVGANVETVDGKILRVVPKNSYEDVKLYVKLDNGTILASNSKGATQIVEVEESFWEELGNQFAKIRRVFSR